MNIPLARKIDGKKFLWDGVNYESREQAQEAVKAYEQDGFEAALIENGDRFLVYSRRVATVQTSG